MVMTKNWQQDEPTEKQIISISNMLYALGEGKTLPIPKTKGEASQIIGELKEVIKNHIEIAGKINTNNWDWEDDSMDFLNNDTF